MPNPLRNTNTQKMVIPTAMIIVGRQRNFALAEALETTSNGSATARPTPLTKNPNNTTEAVTQSSPLKAILPTGVPGMMKARIMDAIPMTMSKTLRTVGKYAGPMRKAVPML